MSEHFNENSTALEVVENIDLKGYEVIVTGSSSGIGVETVKALAKAGARCIMCCRDINKGKQIANETILSTKNDKVEVENLELNSLENINRFVQRFLAKNRPLNILINNAGIIVESQSFTENGFETQFGVNYLGHFALTIGLLPSLKEGAKILKKKSRVINLTSAVHAGANIDFNDLNFVNGRQYDPFISYSQSKACISLFSLALTNRYFDDGIVSNSVMPGVTMTNLMNSFSKETMIRKGWINSDGSATMKMKCVENGAATTVWTATAADLEGKGKLYLEDCGIGKETFNAEEVLLKLRGFVPYIMNNELADKLWDISEKYIQRKSP
ncbi:uncharacterized protein LOC136082319 [Hydra vulgaris]|uniref:uncharacterized protein LOC100201190 n=1 Tax=Hydra vulgaris TaxID=6087 RepID=UPI001F5E6CE8|nr:short-chain dehydrogenase TIC 32, chloroplastic-like [Hydra vulgaris]